MATTERTGIAELYERDVLPALMGRLDQAFPEFAWRRDPRGWHASNQEFTHTTLGVRADRVICHGTAPRGFLIHGQGPVLWTTYVNHGHPARGREFVEAVRKLASRAGVEVERLDSPPTMVERNASLLQDAFAICQRELASDRGGAGRDYLRRRGIPREQLAESGLGVVPDPTRIRLELLSAGYTAAEVAASGLLADTRWPGRIVGAWRDEHTRVVTLWARTIRPGDADRYLYLRGAPRAGAIPYGLAEVLATKGRDDRDPVLVVEGVLDAHVLRANGVSPVAALGGTAVGPQFFEQLADLGVESIALALDNDPAGHDATARSIDASVRASRSPDLWIVDPDLLGTAKDPAEVICERGADAWRALSLAPVCAVAWRALDVSSQPATEHEHEPSRRTALARAETWLYHLPDRLAVEQDTALTVVAHSLGYDPESVRRAFVARRSQSRRQLDVSRRGSMSR